MDSNGNRKTPRITERMGHEEVLTCKPFCGTADEQGYVATHPCCLLPLSSAERNDTVVRIFQGCVTSLVPDRGRAHHTMAMVLSSALNIHAGEALPHYYGKPIFSLGGSGCVSFCQEDT